MRVIDHITIRGFKSIKAIEQLPMRAVNILIGANGSGKSNFLGVFGILQAADDEQIDKYVKTAGGADRLLHFGRKTTQKLLVHAQLTRPDHMIRLILLPTSTDGLYEEVFSSSLPILLPNLVRGFHFHDTSVFAPLRSTAKLNDNRSLRPDGSNLAAFLYLLQKRHETVYKRIVSTIQLVAPFIRDFSLAPTSLAPDTIRLEWRDQNSDQYFDVASLSDGTLRFIALAVLLLQPDELMPKVILIDEPELGLHPAAIPVLGGLIKQASFNAQLIVSTQSPQLVDQFQPEDILIAELVDGATQIRRLEPEPLKAWLEDYSLGQLWEKNELGGRPVPV
ncbi:MAG: chromosome segregation protein SMC [Acidobacteria bacterium]|nr:chromosome segregation protein SMC [Acidobacteriota bacterium]